MEELAAIAAIVAVIQKIYSAYQTISGLLAGPTVSPEQQIIDELQQLAQQLSNVQTAVNALQSAVRALIAEVELEAFDATLQNVQAQQALAATGAEEFAQWLAGGKTDALGLESAKNNSLTAANTMRDTTAFFVLPEANPQTGTAQNTFDYRVALVQYVYVLTVRIGIIVGTESAWNADTVILAELKSHADRLEAIIMQMNAAIQFHQFKSVGGNQYKVQAWCSDTISGYSTDVFQSPTLDGADADADALLTVMQNEQHAQVSNAIGLTAVMQFHDSVSYDAEGAPSGGVWTPWSEVGPSIGPDTTRPQGTPPGFVFPVAAVSAIPSGLSLFWVLFNGSINGRV